jgi:predicted polyphosphate/ATP-dependent NAD kinase
MNSARRLGVVINPIAGMGGRVGLHGTDGVALLQARERGAEPVAPLRARRTLARLRSRVEGGVEYSVENRIVVLSAGGQMGSAVLTELGWQHHVVHRPGDQSTADDTWRAVSAMRAADVSLVLFVGGDGTARDVVEAAGPDLPVLGVPAGVKMHSGVFATTPEAAADVAARFLSAPEQVGTTSAEVVDLGADGRPALLGAARIPSGSGAIQGTKAGSPGDDTTALAGLGREVASEMVPGRLYLLGPGTTVAHVSAALGLPASLLGVDAVLDGQLIARDLSEAQIHELLRKYREASLVLGVVGGQGFLLGRGNQQISAAVLEAIGPDSVIVLAAAGKLAALEQPVLRVDLGDAAPSTSLSGYRKVRTGRGRSTVLRIASAPEGSTSPVRRGSVVEGS